MYLEMSFRWSRTLYWYHDMMSLLESHRVGWYQASRVAVALVNHPKETSSVALVQRTGLCFYKPEKLPADIGGVPVLALSIVYC